MIDRGLVKFVILIKVHLILVGEENQMVRLICIPKFSSAYTAVIVDLETLDTEFVCFGTG